MQIHKIFAKAKHIKLISCIAFVILLFLLPLFLNNNYQLHVLIMAGLAVILACSVRLIGASGLLSLAHGGMMAVGAYTSTLLVIHFGISSWLGLLAAGAAAGLLAALVGYPFIRLKGAYFALCTVFLGEVITLLVEQWEDITGGIAGIVNIPRPDAIVIPGLLNIDFSSKVDYYYFILILVLVILIILYALEHSHIGRTWFSIGQDDSLAESVGMNTARLKVLNFSICCIFAGIAGGFYSQYITAINPSVFSFTWSIYIVIYMTVGGMTSFFGPIVGAVIMTLLPESAAALKQYEPYVFALVLVLVIVFLPDGLVSLPRRLYTICKEKFTHHA